MKLFGAILASPFLAVAISSRAAQTDHPVYENFVNQMYWLIHCELEPRYL
jgi:hypothetical protein